MPLLMEFGVRVELGYVLFRIFEMDYVLNLVLCQLHNLYYA